MRPRHAGSTSLSHSKDKSVVELLFTCDQLNSFREPPARAYNPEPEGVGKDKFNSDGRVVGRLRLEILRFDRVELWEAKWSSHESICIYDV